MPCFLQCLCQTGRALKRLNTLRLSSRVESPRHVAAMARYNRRYIEAEEKIMAIDSGSLPFTASLVHAAPQAAGVFALWQAGGIVYYGRAMAIRDALGGHFEARSLGAPRVTGCSWDVAADPEARYRELMREYASAHRCLPLWNDPQRLPTA